jgi:hypothetical protein
LDLYDDHAGDVLRGLLPDPSDVPDFIKQASPVTADADDHEFALVMIGGDGKKRRKFAHVDPGNTALSVMYFLERRHVLPEEMRKHAAHNLLIACAEQELTPPEPLAKEAAAHEPELEGFHDSTVYEAVFLSEPPEVRQPSHSVDGVPLDTFGEVEKAATWFDDNHQDMHPSQRRTVAVGIDKRATALGVDTSSELARYAGDSYSKDLGLMMATRERLMGHREEAGAYNLLLDKQASLTPDAFVEAVVHMDVALGLDRHWDGEVPDPWWSTFDKVASEDFVHTDGIDRVTGVELATMARDKLPQMKQHFPDDMVTGFAKNPVAVFKSMPAPIKTMLMRMARDYDHPPA